MRAAPLPAPTELCKDEVRKQMEHEICVAQGQKETVRLIQQRCRSDFARDLVADLPHVSFQSAVPLAFRRFSRCVEGNTDFASAVRDLTEALDAAQEYYRHAPVYPNRS